MESKGKINLLKVDTPNGFRLVKELLDRVEKDALNIKKEEIEAIKELVVELEHRVSRFDEYKKNSDRYDICLDLLTPVQFKKLIGRL